MDEDKKHPSPFCPYATMNPHPKVCPYIEVIITLKTDTKWLKRGYWIQAAFAIGTFIAVLGPILAGR